MATRNTLTSVRRMISGPWAFCESIILGVEVSELADHAPMFFLPVLANMRR